MVDQKFIDYGSLLGAGIISLIVETAPQLKEAMFGNDPTYAVIFDFAILGLSQVGSYFAKKQLAKKNLMTPVPSDSA